MRKLLAISLCLAVSFHYAANAEPSINNWKDVVAALTERGITPSTVEWKDIDPLCISYQNKNSQMFHQCRYEKALLKTLYDTDLKQCKTRSKAHHPSRLTQPGNEEVTCRIDSDGDKKETTRELKAISAQELAERYQAYFIECMQDLGWADAKNWKLGKRCE